MYVNITETQELLRCFFFLRANADIGFQPVADHLPVEVIDTDEVRLAKEHFQAGFEAMKVRLAQAEKDRLENKVHPGGGHFSVS